MDGATLLIVGNGVLAGHVVYILSHGTGYQKISIGARNQDKVIRQVNMLKQHAVNLGREVDIEPVYLNLDDTAGTAAAIARTSPDVIFNTATMQSWWVVSTLPAALRYQAEETRFGPWLPMHLSPTLKLMQAVKASGSLADVVNAAFPDAVNPILARNGLAPAIGIGNIANVVPALRIAVADHLRVTPRDVDVRICGHHFVSYRLSRLGHADGAPVYFHASVNGSDVGQKIDEAKIFDALAERYRRVGGKEGQPITASSAVAVLEALQARHRTLVHAPGPNGFPGGYPVWLSKSDRAISLPDNISLDDAIGINERGQIHDGIESIEPDGTVHFAAPQMAAMKDLCGYQCETLRLGDVHDAAAELAGRYRWLLKSNQLVPANG